MKTYKKLNERSYHFEDACFFLEAYGLHPLEHHHWDNQPSPWVPDTAIGCSGSHGGNGDPVLRSLVCRQMAASRWNSGLPKVGSAHRRICDVYIIFFQYPAFVLCCIYIHIHSQMSIKYKLIQILYHLSQYPKTMGHIEFSNWKFVSLPFLGNIWMTFGGPQKWMTRQGWLDFFPQGWG